MADVVSGIAWGGPGLGLGIGAKGHRSFYCHLVSPHPHTYFPESIDPTLFERIVRRISRRFEIITVGEAASRALRGDDLDGTASISTDDGLAENYGYFAPILDSFGVRGTMFCVSSCIDNRSLMWRSRVMHIVQTSPVGQLAQVMQSVSAELGQQPPGEGEDLRAWSSRWPYAEQDRLATAVWEASGIGPLSDFLDERAPYLTSSQLRELASVGFEVGSHSATHPDLAKLSTAEVIDEVDSSVRLLSEVSDSTVVSFASPFGSRARPQSEARAASESGLIAMLGIRRTRNGSNPLKWERDGLEYGARQSIIDATLKPPIRRALSLLSD
jgi:peptidoglycan/xylan/chitin deacetylase (PgdA/CDA1 family)